MKKAVVPGSFDPITQGHLDIIKRAAEIFDTVYVTVMVNAAKTTLFSLEERVEIAKAALKDVKNVVVESSDGLLVEYAKSRGANVIVKGARNSTDFDYENSLAQINYMIDSDIDTLILPTKKELACISSTCVRELIKYNKPLDGTVPPEAIKVIKKLIK